MKKTLSIAGLCALCAFTGILSSANAGDYSKGGKSMIEQAAVCDPRWYISIGGGIDIDFQATDFVSSTQFEPYSGDPNYVHDYKSRSYDDVYGNTLYRIQGEIGYVLNDHIELFGLFKYAGGYGNQYVDKDIESTFAYGVFIYPGDYKSWGGELGLRYFFMGNKEPWHVRPYVSISGGATYVEDIGVTAVYGYGTGYVPAFHGNLYDSTVVGTGALMLGLEIPISCHWAFGVEGGVRYESGLNGTDVIRRTFTYYDTSSSAEGTYDIGGNPEHYNNDGSRLYFPANVYLKFRF